MQKSSPFEFLIKNRSVVMGVISEGITMPNAWKILLNRLPEIKEVIKFNTFKVYARILPLVDQVIKEELDEIRQKNHESDEQILVLKQELDKVRQKLFSKKKQLSNPIIPKRINGWGVQFRNGYYRLFKKIDKKVKWIHIGKVWDIDLAKRKIDGFNLKRPILTGKNSSIHIRAG